MIFAAFGISVKLPILIPDQYIFDLSLRLSIYRRLGEIRNKEDFKTFEYEMINLKHIVWYAIVIRRATCRAPRHNYVGGFFVRACTSFRNGQRVGRGGEEEEESSHSCSCDVVKF